MKKFKVHISEVLGRDVYVKAEDFDEAYDIVNELCNSDIICLNGKDFDDRNIEVLCESDNNVDTSKVYTKEDIKTGISEYKTDKEIFRHIQKLYRMDDAIRHCEDLGYDNLNSDDIENIADTFLKNYDCNISENAQFENIIKNYVTKTNC
mgnify:CR=1 FL=1